MMCIRHYVNEIYIVILGCINKTDVRLILLFLVCLNDCFQQVALQCFHHFCISALEIDTTKM